MAKSYMIFTEAIADRDAYDAYAQKALPTILEAGGRVLVVDDDAQTIEGDWHGPRTIVLEFDSVDAARAWYASSSYQAIVGERFACTESNATLVREFEMPSS